jgi:hypothetical protein
MPRVFPLFSFYTRVLVISIHVCVMQRRVNFWCHLNIFSPQDNNLKKNTRHFWPDLGIFIIHDFGKTGKKKEKVRNPTLNGTDIL